MSSLVDDAARRLWSNSGTMCAMFVVFGIVALALFGPWLNPNGAETLDWLHVASKPALQNAHWFGTDRLGRDLFVRTLEGTRVSLAVGLVASAVSLLVGIAYGAVSGYLGGRTDHLMMRLIEILSGLPLIFFVIFLTVIFGRNEYLLFLSIGAVGWLTMARIVRGQTLSVRQKEFTLTIPQIIMLESFLSFLGLGIQEPGASLGTLIAEGAGEMEVAPWMLLVPGGFLAALLLALNVLGDGLRDALDVKEG
jgi:oligopeptide transport system permease protein